VKFKDFRPISILPALSKVLELVMRDQIMTFCDESGLISEFQSGFRPGQSTTTALLKVTDDISVELERKFITILVHLDFSKDLTLSVMIYCVKSCTLFLISLILLFGLSGLA
jgi:hypothetical protein